EGRLETRQKAVLWLASLWLGVFFVFLFFFLPQKTFFRLFDFPAVIFLLCFAVFALSPTNSRRTFVASLFVIVLGLANFLFLMYPCSRVEKYPPLAFALQMNREWPPGTIIFYASQNSDEALVRYFNPETRWNSDLNQLQQVCDAWLETTAIDRLSSTSEGAQWLKAHTRPESFRELDNGTYHIRFIQVVPCSTS